MDKTLLILGAGSSYDFCRVFPTGSDLIKDINYHFINEKNSKEIQKTHGIYLSALMNHITDILGNDEELFQQIKKQLWEIQLNYEWEISRNIPIIPISIDNFICKQIKEGKLHAKAEKIIKFSIYYLIKGAEQAYTERKNISQKNWIKELAKRFSTVDFKDINKNLKIITFNYDRTFEKYFIDYSNEFRPLSTDQVLNFQNNIKHVYGSLGSLNEISFSLPNNKVNIIKEHYQRIKLIDDRNDIHLMINDAAKYKAIHFIGFGYDPINMKLINVKQFTSATLNGTAYNFSPTEIKNLKTQYNINAYDISCKDYIKNI